ncbi:membrane protein [Acrocarpospora phusangensis]|uniref:Membrane protein n=1 Tax=Acrocarpospora phusangensis TaxID=1070424 RepID=A0A919UVV8_9ACTN|nr:DUF2092 domain-containing protein [Acrocarpospora phusangensis]GIH29780.1 membrane protein [Acrocarpospora phusangensis]
MPKRARAVRWGVPVAAIAVVAGAVGAGPVIAAVQGDPVLPERTAQQLLADVGARLQSGELPPMSGTIIETASLGVPGLSSLAGAASGPVALLAGSHQVKIWYGSATQLRIALPGHMSEHDLIVNGDQTWWWDSAANTATRIKTPVGEPARSLPPTVITPQEAAERALAAADGNTTVSVGNDATVAGRAAYELVLAPTAASSLVKDIRVAVDGETFIPLRVQVHANDSVEPAFEVGFDSVTFTRPAPENFTFTPPPGAKVEDGEMPSLQREHKPGHPGGSAGLAGKKGEAKMVGSGWTTVVVLPLPADALTGGGDESGDGGRDFGERQLSGLADGVLNAATPVSGTWGKGRLIKTKLVSVLLTDDGRAIAGAVTPEVLYEVAGRK